VEKVELVDYSAESLAEAIDLRNAINRQPEPAYSILELERNGWTLAEIANALKLPLFEVYRARSKAIERLRKELSGDDD
jgi:DNA-directed RNA polymerase specialized sigma24 family protein